VTYCWTLPWPVGVSVNHLYLPNAGHGKRWTPEAAAYSQAIILTIRQQAIDAKEKLALPAGDLAISLDLHPPDRRRADGDNYFKLVVDSVAAAFGIDDSRFSEHHAVRFPVSTNPRLVVWVTRARAMEERAG
jgi:Holliday junction resolvase RusA-like endonuclease